MLITKNAQNQQLFLGRIASSDSGLMLHTK